MEFKTFEEWYHAYESAWRKKKYILYLAKNWSLLIDFIKNSKSQKASSMLWHAFHPLDLYGDLVYHFFYHVDQPKKLAAAIRGQEELFFWMVGTDSLSSMAHALTKRGKILEFAEGVDTYNFAKSFYHMRYFLQGMGHKAGTFLRKLGMREVMRGFLSKKKVPMSMLLPNISGTALTATIQDLGPDVRYILEGRSDQQVREFFFSIKTTGTARNPALYWKDRAAYFFMGLRDNATIFAKSVGQNARAMAIALSDHHGQMLLGLGEYCRDFFQGLGKHVQAYMASMRPKDVNAFATTLAKKKWTKYLARGLKKGRNSKEFFQGLGPQLHLFQRVLESHGQWERFTRECGVHISTPTVRPKQSVKPNRCPYCHDDISHQDSVVVCPSCQATHHADCVKENAGHCATCHYDMRAGPQHNRIRTR